MFLILRRLRTLVAWILLVGALAVAVVMAAFVVAERVLRDDPDSALGAWALLVAQEWPPRPHAFDLRVRAGGRSHPPE